ncbi:hypothetical protein [Nannocystis punicea]|uniref:Secreted protein n=1 Tax=Nannocystis punicea TaxID=2995304 RepID=A0ABY7H5K5_9BACT|nr:hypothetical protein [Nannocystis poenicansa]WAS94568.1 hypothetical protein O0S08_00275 [Nannocystis poenicansa]
MFKLWVLLGVLASPDGATSSHQSSPASEFTEAAEPASAGSWGCIQDILSEEDAAYCLANCEGFAPDAGRPAYRHKVRVGHVPADWCADRARKYCHRRGLELNYACWGDYFSW